MNSLQKNNLDNNPLTQMLNGNSGNPFMGLLASLLTGNNGGSNGGGNNMLDGLLSSLGGNDNNILGSLMNGLGGQSGNMLGSLLDGLGGQGGQGGQGNNVLDNLMSGLNGQGNDIIGNLMNNSSSGNMNTGNGNSRNGNSKNDNSSNRNPVPKVVKNNKNNLEKVNNISDLEEYEQVEPISNIFSGSGSIDLSEISNMLSGIDFSNLDFGNANINEMINSMSNNNSFESNDVEFKHTNPKERTHNILGNLEQDDVGQLVYILAHLVDDRKLDVLNKIVEENSK